MSTRQSQRSKHWENWRCRKYRTYSDGLSLNCTASAEYAFSQPISSSYSLSKSMKDLNAFVGWVAKKDEHHISSRSPLDHPLSITAISLNQAESSRPLSTCGLHMVRKSLWTPYTRSIVLVEILAINGAVHRHRSLCGRTRQWHC